MAFGLHRYYSFAVLTAQELVVLYSVVLGFVSLVVVVMLANTAVAVFLVEAPDQDVARLEFAFLAVAVVLEEFPGLLSEVALYVALLGGFVFL